MSDSYVKSSFPARISVDDSLRSFLNLMIGQMMENEVNMVATALDFKDVLEDLPKDHPLYSMHFHVIISPCDGHPEHEEISEEEFANTPSNAS